MLDNRIQTFLTVCEEMNFTKAATLLHITQPAVSQHIQYIENYYGVKLFSFLGKRMTLTEEGQLLKNSLTILRNNEIYLKEQLSMLTDKKKTLHFGATLTVGEFMIAKPLSGFLQQHRDADVSVTVANTKELLQKLDLGEIDFAILEGDYPQTLYAHTPYVSENFIPICSPKYHFRKTPKSLLDLTGERLLLREVGSGTRSILEHALLNYQISFEDFPDTLTIGNMNAIKELVIDGCGITFLYESAVAKELTNGQLLLLPLQDFSLQHEISIVWKRDNLFESSFKELFLELFHIECPSSSAQA